MTKEMAIDILRGVVLGTNEQTHEAVFMAIKALKEQERVDAVAPRVDPVKHGHWVEQEHEDWKWSKEYRCSECGQYRLVTTPVGREWNYCPSCGAKMNEVETK